MAKIVVLGAGMVGSAIARTLCKEHELISVDRSSDVLDKINDRRIRKEVADLRDKSQISKVIKTADLVIGAVPGFMAYEMVKNVIECGKNIVDISFFPEDASPLNDLAKRKNIIAIYDAGVAPGMDNILLAHHDAEMQVHRFICMVGGLPKSRSYPFQYKAPFSPADVLEEYTRPARLKENGSILVKPALTEIESIEFDQLGTIEAFNTDGLRSLLYTMPHIDNMKEKTLRYPGHAAAMQLLKEIGFLQSAPVKVGNQKISPLALSSQLIFPHWQYAEGEEELTIMRVIIEGLEKKEMVRYIYNLHDITDHKNKMSSMARTTGFTACAIAEIVLKKLFTSPGVHPPEMVGYSKKCFDYIMRYMNKRNVIYKMSKEMIY